ncbi:MAG: hypothetical protein M5U26_25225 [Planctomycetota bacterium]|nr:hypothetical protein [Planctomycetota bacterium]
METKLFQGQAMPNQRPLIQFRLSTLLILTIGGSLVVGLNFLPRRYLTMNDLSYRLEYGWPWTVQTDRTHDWSYNLPKSFGKRVGNPITMDWKAAAYNALVLFPPLILTVMLTERWARRKSRQTAHRQDQAVEDS